MQNNTFWKQNNNSENIPRLRERLVRYISKTLAFYLCLKLEEGDRSDLHEWAMAAAILSAV